MFFIIDCKNSVSESFWHAIWLIPLVFVFFQESILFSSQNYNSKFLHILEVYLHELKLISHNPSHSLKSMYLQKCVQIWCLYFTKISGNFVLKTLENLENSGNFTLKFLSEPWLQQAVLFQDIVWLPFSTGKELFWWIINVVSSMKKNIKKSFWKNNWKTEGQRNKFGRANP